MCTNETHSKEHVPAKGFFPEEERYRKNLITVRSCAEHNENTSKDDQYIRDVVVMSAFGSIIAEKQYINKTHPNLIQQPDYLKLFLVETLKVVLGGYTTTAFSIDRDRFNRTVRKYAYGIYYYKFKKHWRRKLTVVTDKLFEKNDTIMALNPDSNGIIIREIKRRFWPPPEGVLEGMNQDVFKYCFIPEDGSGDNTTLVMVFYDKFDVWVIAENNDCNPIL